MGGGINPFGNLAGAGDFQAQMSQVQQVSFRNQRNSDK